MELLKGMVTEGEGNITLFNHRIEKIQQLLRQYKPQYIVEIGFNLGHSCKLIIDTLQSLDNYDGIKKFYVFDICEGTNSLYRDGKFFENIGGNHNYVKPNFEILKKYYDVDIQLIEGDSMITVKPFMDNIDHELDFVEIDGFHEGDAPKNDILSVIDKLKSGGVIYMDDYNNYYPAIKKAVNDIDWVDFNTYISNDIFYAVKK